MTWDGMMHNIKPALALTFIKYAHASLQQIAVALVPGQIAMSNGATALAGCMPRWQDSFASHDGSTGPKELGGCALR